MKYTFKLGTFAKMQGGQNALLLYLNETPTESLESFLNDDKEKVVQLDYKRKKRSLNANAYLWSLLDKLAKKLGTTDEELYIDALRKYGAKDYVVTVEDAIPVIERVYKIVEVVNKVMVNGKEGVQLRLVRGSSKYDSKEFSVLLNGVVDECRTIGVETLNDIEINEIIERWKPI